MGKAAENEGIKLRAAWFNNASVGLTVAGFIIPGFSIIRAADNLKLFNDWVDGRYEPTFLDGLQLIATLGIFFLVPYFAVLFRDEAKKEIAKIQD